MCAKLFGSVYGNVLYSVSYLLLRVSGQVFRFLLYHLYAALRDCITYRAYVKTEWSNLRVGLDYQDSRCHCHRCK